MTSQRRHRAAAFTLSELVVSLAVITILAGGMASAVLIASHAVPDEESLPDRIAAETEAVDRISGDLALATALAQADSDAVGFTVPDRGHGSDGPESIRYAWSGTPGDPLTYEYNGAAAVTLADDVHAFSVSYTCGVLPPADSPRLLLVVDDEANPSAEDQLRRSTMDSWGYTVQLISSSASQAEYDAMVPDFDVAYVSETASSTDLGVKLRDAPIGVLNEDGLLCDEFGFASSAQMWTADAIDVVDTTHEITSYLETGSLTICSSYQQLVRISGTPAPGGRTLAVGVGISSAMLFVLEPEATLYGGGEAAGRRVMLPWGNGGFTFDFGELSSDGLKLMRRAMAWAAAPIVYAAATITLQVGPDTGGRIEAQVTLLNTPSVKGT